jgi:integrase
VRLPEMKPRSHTECARHLRTHWQPLHKFALHEVTSDMVADQLKVMGTKRGPVARNRARSSLSAMYAWAIIERFSEPRPVNPVIDTGKVDEGGSRERTLTDAELAAIWLAAPTTGYGRIVRLLMLTAQRREEIGGLRWQEIESPDSQGRALIALPGERTKNHRAHDVPLSAAALESLSGQPRIAGRELVFGEGEGGYSGWSRSKERLDADCGIADWTLHDLRRTAATRMADLGVQPHVIEAILNHASGHKAGVAGIYNRSTYAAEKRAALDLWANHLRMIVAQAEGANVTRVRKRA